MVGDISLDYEHFPTFSPLPDGMETENAFVRCEGCGGTVFHLRKAGKGLLCAHCRQEMLPLPSMLFPASDAEPQAMIPEEDPHPESANDDLFHEEPGSEVPTVEEFIRNNPALKGIVESQLPPEPEFPSTAISSAPWFQFARSKEHSAVLRPDGTVQAIGANKYGQCNVQDWKEITAIAAASGFTAGLAADGKVKYAGYNWMTRNKISGWSNITAIAAGSNFLAALCADGSVKAHGIRVPVYSGITAIAAGENHLVARSVDGSVRAIGLNSQGMCNVQDWSGITAVAAGSQHTIGLCEDGTVRAVGYQKKGKFEKASRCDVQEWTGMTAIAAGSFHTVGLRADGRVYAVGSNKDGQCDVWDWDDVIAICAGADYTAALRSDGTILCTDPTAKKLMEEVYCHF